MAPLITHGDVTTIMEMSSDLRDELRRIRMLLEDEDGEEEGPDDDA